MAEPGQDTLAHLASVLIAENLAKPPERASPSSEELDEELEVEPSNRVSMEKKQSYSCSELPHLYSIREEGDSIHNSEIHNTNDEEFLQEC